MKQRITYIQPAEDAATGKGHATVKGNSITLPSLVAAKEHRITIGLSELPQELVKVLDQCHELHIRWAAGQAYTASSPYNARVAPSLHVFLSPQKNIEANLLCPLLKRAFSPDIKCSLPSISFSKPPILSARFTSSTTYQYFSLLDSLHSFSSYLQDNVCATSDAACHAVAKSVNSAAYIDLDYDAISHALTATAFWEASPGGRGWSETIQPAGADERVEVGILHPQDAEEREELRMGGFLTVLGDDDHPKPTLFSFPSRHHPLTDSTGATTFTTDFDKPTGLHPTLRLQFPSHPHPPPTPSDTKCALHAYLTLPSTLFIDRYPLSDALTLASHNLTALHALSGATDLEAPDWTVPQWGFAALLELATPPSPSQGPFAATLPLHLRYLPPAPGGYSHAQIPPPTVFWACTADEGTKFPVNPFDRTHLGYDALFGPRTMFYHLAPDGGGSSSLLRNVTVPVLDLSASAAPWVESGTVGVVVLGFLYILWQLFKPLPARAAREETGKKKIK